LETDIRVRQLPPCRSQNRRVQQGTEMEDHAMSLIRNAYAVSTRRGFLGALCSVLLALAMFYPGAATSQEQVKEIRLTDKHIQGFIAAAKDMAKLYDGANPDAPDPKVEAEAEAVAKKNGFASLAEYDDVVTNITLIMSGIYPQTSSEIVARNRRRPRA
jgi:hypothetical protein